MLLRCQLRGVPIALLLKYKEDSCCVSLCSNVGCRRRPALVQSTTVPLHPRSSPRNRRTSLRHAHTDRLPCDAVDSVSGTARSCSIARPAVAEAPSTLATVQDATTKRSTATAATFLHAAGVPGDDQGPGSAVVSQQRDAAAEILALFDHWQLPCMPPRLATTPTRPAPLPQTAGSSKEGNAAASGRRSGTAVRSREGEAERSSAACEAVAMLAAVLQHLHKASTPVRPVSHVEAEIGATAQNLFSGAPGLAVQTSPDLCVAAAVSGTVIITHVCASSGCC